MITRIFLAALSLWLPAVQAQDITLRHDLSGSPLDALATLVVRFNGEQQGKARVMLQDLKGVADKQQTPHLALLDPADSAAFFGTSPRFLPLHKIMADSKLKLDARMFFPQMAAAVDDLTGKIQALPLAQALPVLFYNRDAFLRAGLDPDNPPKTWWEVQTAAGKLFDAGFKCPLTSSRFAWVHLDNMSSQHGEPIMVRDGKADRVALNTMVHVKHIALLASWQKSFYFHYFGPGREGDAKFMSGECSMLTGESPLYRDLEKSPGFRFGVSELPYYDDVRGARPADVLPDGAALWALPGKHKDEYAVAARFVTFMMKPENQREWVQGTGFLPMSPAATDALKAAGTPAALLDRAVQRLSRIPSVNERTKNGSGRSRIRGILNEEIEFVWGNKKPAKEALDTAMDRVRATVEIAPAPPLRLGRKN
ncbi:MAG: extracellular solute-binding protein [Gammaproteobacteria bacterium]|nr:extracellular solute-binding protein [Gammaproteobacteria bacterium]MBU1646074.1 extracellular solute-binding protein [Gammaproteobacteria bacterium]MBU1972136.1 extracellular solute-binding protein [Gammaproteobacteria bacterium]